MKKSKVITAISFLLSFFLLLPAVPVSASSEGETLPAKAEDETVIETQAATLTMAQYDTRVSAFINDARWEHGIAWPQRSPKLSTYGSKGCCAYCADFAAYVYSSPSLAWTDPSKFSKFTNPNEIRSGDIIYMTNGPHWMVVLYRRGNTLYTAEGSFPETVRISSQGYFIKDGALYRNSSTVSKMSMSTGYHYKFSDIAYIYPSFTNNTPSVTAHAATLSMTLNKNRNTTVMGFGATLYDASGTKLASRSIPLDENNFRATTKALSFTVGSGKQLNYALTPGTTYQYTFSAIIDGYSYTSGMQTFTTPATTCSLELYGGHSGKNYLLYSDFRSDAYKPYWYTRDSSVYALSRGSQPIDPGDPNSAHYNTFLRITGSTPGSSGHDMVFMTSTNGSRAYSSSAGDTRPMVLSFWAKSSVPGARLFLRWGYEGMDDYKSITLSGDWTCYRIPMDKSQDLASGFHPYFDQAGTFYLAEVQLEDGTTPTAFAEETGEIESTVYAEPGTTYSLPESTRAGYQFLGWYTQMTGGEQITAATKVPAYHQRAYAHWKRLPLPFNDVHEGDWFYDMVSDAYFTNIMTGYGDGSSFGPADSLARAHFATILWRLEGSPSASYHNQFSDVYAGDWYAGAVAWANSVGIISGYSNGRFGPGDNLTREQLAVMMYRYAKHKNYSLSLLADLSSFSDAGSVSDYAGTEMSWAVANGIISGKHNGTALEPMGTASRAETATIMVRFINQFR